MSNRSPKVVIVGGGFAGLAAAKKLADAPVEVTLIDRRNFHLFQPLLYQVATGGLSPANIAAPLRRVLRKQRNVSVLLGEVTGFDLAGRRVLLADGEVPYDWLIVAAGSREHYFGHDEWRELAPGLKSIEDATSIRSRILLAFETAERAEAPETTNLAFVVIGGGPTGVELAGAIAEIARHSLRREYRRIRPEDARVVLIEAAPRILPTYPELLSRQAEASLSNLGVEVLAGWAVTDVTASSVRVAKGNETRDIESGTVLWAAGVRASALGAGLVGAENLDRQGRVMVASDLSVPGHPEVFVTGDLAHYEQSGAPLPGVAPVAMQQGAYAAQVILDRLAGKQPAPFRYHDRGSMATIGRSAAVADIGPVKLHGLPGWLAWLFIHLMNLAGFENRLLVLTQWAWNYWTRNRSARLITTGGRNKLD